MFGLLAILAMLGGAVQLVIGNLLDAALMIAVGGACVYVWHRRRKGERTSDGS